MIEDITAYIWKIWKMTRIGTILSRKGDETQCSVDLVMKRDEERAVKFIGMDSKGLVDWIVETYGNSGENVNVKKNAVMATSSSLTLLKK